MTKQEALTFLQQHQPMPDDAKLTEPLMRRYDEVRNFFIAHPAPECIPLFLGSFGDGNGFGIYQVCDEVFWPYRREQVVPHLVEALGSSHKGVRYWASQWAMDHPSEALVEPLQKLLQSEEDEDAHIFAIGALEFTWRETGSSRALEVLRERGKTETDPERRVIIDSVLAESSAG